VSRHRESVQPTTPFEDLPHLLSVRQVASYIGCSPGFVYQQIWRGAIEHQRLGKRFIVIPKNSVACLRAAERPLQGASAACGAEVR